MHLIGLAAPAMSNSSRVLCQMRFTLISKLRVYQCCVSMHDKVIMSLTPGPFYMLTQVYTCIYGSETGTILQADVNVYGSETGIILKADVNVYGSEYLTILQADANQLEALHVRCQRRVIGLGWHDFVSNEEVRTRTRLVPLHETVQKQRVSLFFRWLVPGDKFRQIKLYGWRLMSGMAWLPWSSQKYVVAASYRWDGKVPEDSRCRRRRSWPCNWRYTSSWACSATLQNRIDCQFQVGFNIN